MYRGNSLITTILLITLLILLSVGLSSLILQSSVNIANVEVAHKAFYGAESGVELALLSLKKHFPGYEENNSVQKNNVSFSYQIASQTNAIPKNDNQNTAEHALPTNEIVTLALFKDTGTKLIPELRELKDVNTSFRLNFHAKAAGENCLRWSLFGFRKESPEVVTESMGGYLACSPVENTLESLSGIGQFKDVNGQFFPAYPIDSFLPAHYQNYLSLSNISSSGTTLAYRLQFDGEAMADEKFVITSTGSMKNFSQTEQVFVPQGELSPSFFFAIFNPK